jgi:hypothetical protein
LNVSERYIGNPEKVVSAIKDLYFIIKEKENIP